MSFSAPALSVRRMRFWSSLTRRLWCWRPWRGCSGPAIRPAGADEITRIVGRRKGSIWTPTQPRTLDPGARDPGLAGLARCRTPDLDPTAASLAVGADHPRRQPSTPRGGRILAAQPPARPEHRPPAALCHQTPRSGADLR